MEPSDKTRVSKEHYDKVINPPRNTRLFRKYPEIKDKLYDTLKAQYYKNLQNFYNTNFFGYGLVGNQTNIDYTTPEGLQAIQANYDYAKNNMELFAEQVATAGITGAINWANTPVEIGAGAESVVTTKPLSTKVTKLSVIPRWEAHLRNQIPGSLKTTFKGKINGLNKYTQSKVKLLTTELILKARKALDRMMARKGYKPFKYEGIEGPAYTNGKWYITDIGEGNVGKDALGRLRLTDFIILNKEDFIMSMKHGNKIINNY